mgnify:CR=1 FL=1
MKKFYKYRMLMPALLLYTAFFIVPAIIGIGYSFTDWSTYHKEISFVGFDNFKQIFQDRELKRCMLNTFKYAVVVVIFKNGLGLLLAIAVNKKIVGRNIFRVIYYIPAVISTIAVGLIFTRILHPDGMLNQLLAGIGLEGLKQRWLVDTNVIMFSIAAVSIWQWTGYHMTIYLAGMQGIDETYYEVARIDGASFWQELRFVMLPLLRPSININIIFSLIGGIKVFSEVFVLTNGGPGSSSQVLATEVFKKFGEGNWGVGTALNMVLLIFVTVICVPLLVYMRKQEVEA